MGGNGGCVGGGKMLQAGLIDWLTLRLDRDDCPDWAAWKLLESWGDRILRYCPATGEKVWEIAAWESLRSDSHQLAIKFSGMSLHVQGSPARVMGVGDTVFGAGDAGRDVFTCASFMIAFVSKLLRVYPVPHVRLWHLTRMDVTANYDLGSLANVRVALAELRNIEGGRYRVSQQAGDTVYYSHLSRLRAGKAYSKGPHLRYLLGQSTYTGCGYTEADLSLSDRLLRLELRLGREWWRRLQVPWWSVPWSVLKEQHDDYFLRMVGVEGIEVTDMGFVDRFISVAPSEGQGKAAARSWALVQTMGWQAARDTMPKSTWYRHVAIWKAAGLGDADISAGRVVSLRRPLILRPVSSWEDLRRAA